MFGGTILGDQRAVIGEYVSGWFHPVQGVLPLHPEVIVELKSTDKIKRR